MGYNVKKIETEEETRERLRKSSWRRSQYFSRRRGRSGRYMTIHFPINYTRKRLKAFGLHKFYDLELIDGKSCRAYYTMKGGYMDLQTAGLVPMYQQVKGVLHQEDYKRRTFFCEQRERARKLGRPVDNSDREDYRAKYYKKEKKKEHELDAEIET